MAAISRSRRCISASTRVHSPRRCAGRGGKAGTCSRVRATSAVLRMARCLRVSLLPMRTTFLLTTLTALLVALPAIAEKPVVRPYAAGSLSGGIPLWNPGEKFVAVAGGACSGTCPVYELFVFSDGRVVFLGKKYTGKTGQWKKQMDPSVYAELVTQVVRTGVLETDLKRGTCLKDRPMLT